MSTFLVIEWIQDTCFTENSQTYINEICSKTSELPTQKLTTPRTNGQIERINMCEHLCQNMKKIELKTLILGD